MYWSCEKRNKEVIIINLEKINIILGKPGFSEAIQFADLKFNRYEIQFKCKQTEQYKKIKVIT